MVQRNAKSDFFETKAIEPFILGGAFMRIAIVVAIVLLLAFPAMAQFSTYDADTSSSHHYRGYTPQDFKIGYFKADSFSVRVTQRVISIDVIAAHLDLPPHESKEERSYVEAVADSLAFFYLRHVNPRLRFPVKQIEGRPQLNRKYRNEVKKLIRTMGVFEEKTKVRTFLWGGQSSIFRTHIPLYSLERSLP